MSSSSLGERRKHRKRQWTPFRDEHRDSGGRGQGTEDNYLLLFADEIKLTVFIEIRPFLCELLNILSSYTNISSNIFLQTSRPDRIDEMPDYMCNTYKSSSTAVQSLLCVYSGKTVGQLLYLIFHLSKPFPVLRC